MNLSPIQENQIQSSNTQPINNTWNLMNGILTFYRNGGQFPISVAIHKLKQEPPNYKKLHVNILEEKLCILLHTGFEDIENKKKYAIYGNEPIDKYYSQVNLMKLNNWFKNYINEDIIPLDLLWEDYNTYYNKLYIYNNRLYLYSNETYMPINVQNFPIKKLLNKFQCLYTTGWTTQYNILVNLETCWSDYLQYRQSC